MRYKQILLTRPPTGSNALQGGSDADPYWPATPSTKTIGTKTQMVVSVLATTARATSVAPVLAASTSDSPSSLRRWIDSSTTIELSTSRPIPSVRPPSDMMLSEIPEMYIRKKVEITDTGIAIPIIMVVFQLLRKR